jgi:hypothetical protein
MQDVVNLPVMAVDLGFAGRRSKSCGLAWQFGPGDETRTKHVSFGCCTEEAAEFLSANTNSALIVEAPLSGLFDAHGNPKGRLPFESSTISGRTAHRYWYVGAGASVGLGAIFLLSRISALVKPKSNVVNLFEGFVSFKTRHSNHEEDALTLLDGLRGASTAELYSVESGGAGDRAVNLLGLSGLVLAEEPCPTVIAVAV